MTRLHRPRGLIRYDSQNGLQKKPTRWIRPRTMLYALLMFIGACVAAWAISTIKPANVGVTRMIGAPYIVDRDFIRNQFLVRLVNKRNVPTRFVLAVQSAPDHLRQSGFDGAIEVPALGEVAAPLVLQQPRGDYQGSFHFQVSVQDEAGTFRLERAVEFLGPEARLLREEEAEEKAAHEHGKEK
jgi:polyferredoxin